MQRVLGLMGEGTISNLSISYKAQGEEIARITYDFEATGGKQSHVAAIITDESRGSNNGFNDTNENIKEYSDAGLFDAYMGMAGGGLQVVGGVILGIGSEGIAAPIAIALIIDGVDRVVLNYERAREYKKGNKAKADAMPANTGALIGKQIDKARGVSQNGIGVYQTGFGLGNDMFSFVAGGGSGGVYGSFSAVEKATKFTKGVAGASHVANIYGFYSIANTYTSIAPAKK